MREGTWLAWPGSGVRYTSNHLCSGENGSQDAHIQSKCIGARVVDNEHSGNIASVFWVLASLTGNNTCCSWGVRLSHFTHGIWLVSLQPMATKWCFKVIRALYRKWGLCSHLVCGSCLHTAGWRSLISPPPPPPYFCVILRIPHLDTSHKGDHEKFFLWLIISHNIMSTVSSGLTHTVYI